MKKTSSALALACSVATLALLASPASAQKRGGGGGGGGGGHSSPPQHSAPQRSAPQRVSPQRENVRTPNFTPRQPQGYSPQQRPPTQVPPPHSTPFPASPSKYQPHISKTDRIQSGRTFTKTPQGRRYSNGLTLHNGIPTRTSWQHHYFPWGHYHYPYYRPTFSRGSSYISPFGFYYGICCPFIATEDCNVYPPAVDYIDIPVYNGAQCTGFAPEGGENYLNDPNLAQDVPGLTNALDDLTETFENLNIDGLVGLINPNTSIAIFSKGQYQYSMPAQNYVDVTRDAIKAMQSSQLSLQYVHSQAPNVFSVGGQQTYRDANGNIQTMWLSFVLQDISGMWTLTQVETAPGVYHDPSSNP